jgi:hypothetical protein
MLAGADTLTRTGLGGAIEGWTLGFGVSNRNHGFVHNFCICHIFSWFCLP